MTPADDATSRQLQLMLDVNPITILRLRGYAEEADMTLAELVRFILGDYTPDE
jgi:hypothetical protein